MASRRKFTWTFGIAGVLGFILVVGVLLTLRHYITTPCVVVFTLLLLGVFLLSLKRDANRMK